MLETNISLYPLSVAVQNAVLCNYWLSLSGLDSLIEFPGWLGFAPHILFVAEAQLKHALVMVVGEGQSAGVIKQALSVKSLDTSINISLSKAIHMA